MNRKEEMDASRLVQILVNQTTYTEQEAREKLALHNNDIYKTLREFMSIPEPVAKKITSVNQTIYKEIRQNLGVVEVNYNESKE
jgi:hypothetical protein